MNKIVSQAEEVRCEKTPLSRHANESYESCLQAFCQGLKNRFGEGEKALLRLQILSRVDMKTLSKMEYEQRT